MAKCKVAVECLEKIECCNVALVGAEFVGWVCLQVLCVDGLWGWRVGLEGGVGGLWGGLLCTSG